MGPDAKSRRAHWIGELSRLGGCFGADTARIADGLRREISDDGESALVDHLRSCGAIPELLGRDSSAEKLYSKYTDAVVSEAFIAMGLRSTVITERADAADVQASCQRYSLVADAKAFRLSRTAKNQKDFKVQAMDTWRGDCKYAVVVCPIYQLPRSSSQIYQQAIARNVCILSYSHLAALVRLGSLRTKRAAEDGLDRILRSLLAMNPDKSASDYWETINTRLLTALGNDTDLWTVEKAESIAGLSQAKTEALLHLRSERERLSRLSREEAIGELVRLVGIETRIAHVSQINHGGLLECPTH